MSREDSALCGLKDIHEGAELWTEGAQPFVYLPKFKFLGRGVRLEMDLLVCPQAHSGYETRLFFEQQVAGVSGVWTTHYVCGRPWHAVSWRGVMPGADWTAILANHLRAVA